MALKNDTNTTKSDDPEEKESQFLFFLSAGNEYKNWDISTQ